jgi:hypothetical protein
MESPANSEPLPPGAEDDEPLPPGAEDNSFTSWEAAPSKPSEGLADKLSEVQLAATTPVSEAPTEAAQNQSETAAAAATATAAYDHTQVMHAYGYVAYDPAAAYTDYAAAWHQYYYPYAGAVLMLVMA